MASTRTKILILMVIIGLFVADCEARKRRKVQTRAQKKALLEKQLILQKRETNSINFSRLVAMRVIYGIASMLGLQERLGGILNGAFVPPGVDEDDYGLDLDDDGDDVDLGDYFDS